MVVLDYNLINEHIDVEELMVMHLNYKKNPIYQEIILKIIPTVCLEFDIHKSLMFYQA
jgi:hypothetical protein